MVAVRDGELNVGRVEAVRDERIHVAALDCVQTIEVVGVGRDVFLDQAEIAALDEDVLGMCGGDGFEVDLEAAGVVAGVGDVGDVADDEWCEAGLGAEEAMSVICLFYIYDKRTR